MPVGAFGGGRELMEQLAPARARLPGRHAVGQPGRHGRRRRNPQRPAGR